jgi:hypothetical protein
VWGRPDEPRGLWSTALLERGEALSPGSERSARAVATYKVWGRVVVVGPGGAELARWPIGGREPPDLAVVDSLCRLQLAAHRAGCEVVLDDLCCELAEILDLVGLCREVGGQAELGEQLLGVQEAVEPGDPLA